VRVRKWVDIGQEVEIEIGIEDIRAGLNEAFYAVTEDRLGEPGPNNAEVMMAFNNLGTFLRAVTAEQIGRMKPAQRQAILAFLAEQALRYEEPKS
jgi:hypothetical protein